MNALLDEFPTEYDGYLIRTDYRIGVQMRLAAEDTELSDSEKVSVLISLLYGNGAPPIEKALNGVVWFLKCGDEEEPAEDKEEPQDANSEATGANQSNFSFEVDSFRLYTAFKKTYGVDLNTARLHWFAFCAMLQDLNECAFTNILEIREKDLSKVPKQQRGEYARLKERFALPQKFTPEEQEKINEFFSLLKD